jgi:uncharacterized protein (TIGR02271 family)
MKTIIAAFKDAEVAERGAEMLKSRPDLDASQVRVLLYDTSGQDVRPAFRESLGEERTERYAEILRRGGAVITAEAEDEIAENIADDLDEMGAVDLEAAATRWRGEGWSGYDEHAQPFDEGAQLRERTSYEDTGTRDVRPQDASRDLDVIEEQVNIGKRNVDRGGVRVRTQVTERPVRQDVTVHDERIDVRREPVDEPLHNAADATFTEDEFEVTAQGEEVVVGKDARIVERVHVGKAAEDRTQQVEETERRRDVEVEQIGTPHDPRRP